ncbi:DNA mismatch repair protein MutS [Dipodascopsis tothii]|uniref:DNA mismatch repair protein MutS n=1 Tax=Dipodascopsis tothii TaxID=44089 RepID=UPI0034CF10A3
MALAIGALGAADSDDYELTIEDEIDAEESALAGLDDAAGVDVLAERKRTAVGSGQEYPTVLREVKENMARYADCVVVTRVGGFYELYFDQAEEYGPLLNLRVGRKHTAMGDVAMAGFPTAQLERYLRILVQDLNKHVAISEEFRRDRMNKRTGNLFDRQVVRVVTPGTLIDERFLDPLESNFLLALSVNGERLDGRNVAAGDIPVGLAWLDLSTGDFYTQDSSVAKVQGDLARISPREVLLDQSLAAAVGANADVDCVQELFRQIEQTKYTVSYEQFPPSITTHAVSPKPTALQIFGIFNATWKKHFVRALTVKDVAPFSTDEVDACAAVLHYVSSKLCRSAVQLQVPAQRRTAESMVIDMNSFRSLEIKRSLRDHTVAGSLLHTIRRTVTKSGARLLTDWVSAPLTDVAAINARQDIVALFVAERGLRQDVVDLLASAGDSQRVLQRFALSRGEAEDMLALARTIEATRRLTERLATFCRAARAAGDAPAGVAELERLLGEVTDQTRVHAKITRTLDEDVLVRRAYEEDCAHADEVARDREIAEDGLVRRRTLPTKKSLRLGAPIELPVMARGASAKLRTLHRQLAAAEAERTGLEKTLVAEYGDVELRWMPGLGHVLHVSGRSAQTLARVRQDPRLRQARATKTSAAVICTDWTELGARIDGTRLAIKEEESRLFAKLKLYVLKGLAGLRANARVLDRVDVLASFAVLADELKLVRPGVNRGTEHRIVGGRHLVVERGLLAAGRNFTPNDCDVGGDRTLWIITGPNMGGKSTFLRQNALISILAQVGSYVPAREADIGIVDQIFSRVGSADNLFRNQSTFMVEMLETAFIVRHATPRSFVIMDEIGRGTAPLEGVAIAYAVLEFLHALACRTLFATHFQELAHMTDGFGRVGLYCTDVAEGGAVDAVVEVTGARRGTDAAADAAADAVTGADGLTDAVTGADGLTDAVTRADAVTDLADPVRSPDGFYFEHRVRPGVCAHSHGIRIAQMAGLPADLVGRASHVQARLAAASQRLPLDLLGP